MKFIGDCKIQYLIMVLICAKLAIIPTVPNRFGSNGNQPPIPCSSTLSQNLPIGMNRGTSATSWQLPEPLKISGSKVL